MLLCVPVYCIAVQEHSCIAAGDPVRLFHHLGLGVWSFLAYPAVGLVDSARGRGPWRIIAGVQEGCSSLIGNVVFAISNATAKGSAALRQVCFGPEKRLQHFKLGCIMQTFLLP